MSVLLQYRVQAQAEKGLCSLSRGGATAPGLCCVGVLPPSAAPYLRARLFGVGGLFDISSTQTSTLACSLRVANCNHCCPGYACVLLARHAASLQGLKNGHHGEVFLARVRSTGRTVVVKRPKEDPHVGGDGVVRLFTHEAAAQVGGTVTSVRFAGWGMGGGRVWHRSTCKSREGWCTLYRPTLAMRLGLCDAWVGGDRPCWASTPMSWRWWV
jgi:hypothetical protein